MALYTYIVLLLCLKYTLAENCVIDNTPEYITWEKELLEDLRCGYSRHQSPKEATSVNFTFIIRSFNFDDVEGIMKIHMWTEFQWKDERLQWDSDKYHGINETDITDHFFIWRPNIALANSEDASGDVYFFGYELKSTGDVLCRHHMTQMTQCIVKLTNWPFDVQECSFELTPKDTLRHSPNYTMKIDFVTLGAESAEWYIMGSKHVPGNGDKIRARVTFFLIRAAVGLSAIVICPAFVLTILSISSICLDVRRNVRLAIICFSLMGHYYFLMELSTYITAESHFPPILLLYYRGSVVLSIIIMLSTFFLSTMCKLESTPHHYVNFINDYVYENNYRSYLVLPRWDFNDGTVASKSNSEDWVKFANIVNSVLIFCVVFTYIILYATSIPKRTYPDVGENFVRIILKPGEY